MPRNTLVAALFVTGAAGLSACTVESTAPAAAANAGIVAEANASATVKQELAALRAALAPYHRIELATAADWPTAITSCWYSTAGAMGYHYANTERFDGVIDPLRPEALVYEPLPGGKYKLVAAEFIVPIAAWTEEMPPRLFGQSFHRNDGLGIYALHVWAWKANPAGMFAAWNTNVSCQYAAESEDRS